MGTHEFVLAVDGIDVTDDHDLDRIFEAGLDDATPSVVGMVQYLDVIREAGSYGQALFEALGQVQDAGGAVRHVLDVDAAGETRPGLVSAADIARRTGWSREYVRLLALDKRGPGGFPRPLRDSPPTLYSWFEVVEWLARHPSVVDTAELIRDIDCELEITGLARTVNAVLELEHLDPALWEQVRVPSRDPQALLERMRHAVGI